MSKTRNADDEGRRWVRIRCPLCGHISPVVDQIADVRRDLMGRWWHFHKETHTPAPIIEVVPPPIVGVQSDSDGGTP